ncbi:MAG TPA: hypothetical protein VFE05_04920 [Longimicrobiaceae bacterium]|nr:hypothetical protein [Longimicrobiaceae bacterium]
MLATALPSAGLSRAATPPTALMERISSHSRGLDPAAAAFRAAVVLLAGAETGFNVERLARRTGYPAHQVAAFVRRLVDHGVHEPCGRAWTSPADERFWNDAGVAEGRLCRRLRPDGSPEWAPAGTWQRAYEYVGREEAGPVVSYLPDEAVADVSDILGGAWSPEVDASYDDEAAVGGVDPLDERADDAAPALTAPAVDLFPGTLWLGAPAVMLG